MLVAYLYLVGFVAGASHVPVKGRGTQNLTDVSDDQCNRPVYAVQNHAVTVYLGLLLVSVCLNVIQLLCFFARENNVSGGRSRIAGGTLNNRRLNHRCQLLEDPPPPYDARWAANRPEEVVLG